MNADTFNKIMPWALGFFALAIVGALLYFLLKGPESDDGGPSDLMVAQYVGGTIPTIGYGPQIGSNTGQSYFPNQFWSPDFDTVCQKMDDCNRKAGPSACGMGCGLGNNDLDGWAPLKN